MFRTNLRAATVSIVGLVFLALFITASTEFMQFVLEPVSVYVELEGTPNHV